MSGQPDDYRGREDYIVMNWNSNSGQWNDVSASANFVGIIEIGDETPTTPEETFTFNGNEYQLTTGVSNWQQAQAQARALGGNLVTINNATEQQWLEDTFGTTERYWTGLNDSASEGNFVWAALLI